MTDTKAFFPHAYENAADVKQIMIKFYDDFAEIPDSASSSSVAVLAQFARAIAFLANEIEKLKSTKSSDRGDQ